MILGTSAEHEHHIWSMFDLFMLTECKQIGLLDLSRVKLEIVNELACWTLYFRSNLTNIEITLC